MNFIFEKTPINSTCQSTISSGPRLRRRARCKVRQPEVGKTLLEFLVDRFSYHSEKEWRTLISQDRLLINDRFGRSPSRLELGDLVEYLPLIQPEPPVELVYEIIYEDNALMAIAKPGNLPIHPAGKFFNHTLWALLKRDRPDIPIHFVNRLDRETSGIVLVAKTPDICSKCNKNMTYGNAEKKYLAIVEGDFPEFMIAEGILIPQTFTKIRKKLEFIPRSSSLFTLSGGLGKARHATTSFRKISGNGTISLLEVELQSGRTHQIRATLAGLDFPLVGDKLYGIDESIFLRFIANETTEHDWQRLRLRRQALHSWRLTLPHPCQHKKLIFEAPLPGDMQSLLNRI